MSEEMTIPARKRVLSGMRPTGKLHLGNYMGALKNWVALQNEVLADGSPKYECYFFIADFHALTTDYADTSRLAENTLEVALDFLSAGLDPQKSTIFVQSHVPQHSELHLLLSMITPLSWLERIPSYKDQQEQLRQKDLNTYGFLGYPLLQSADILVYQAEFVPVGQDQIAHVEITREIARRFNLFYGPKPATVARMVAATESDKEKLAALEGEPRTYAGILPEPKVLLTPSPKLPGIDGRKMSKSYGNTILLTDQPSVVQTKMAAMSNGGQRTLQSEPGDPDVCPVGDIHNIFSSTELNSEIRRGCRNASIGCLDCKLNAAESILHALKPIQERRFQLELDSKFVSDALIEGAKRATHTAEKTMIAVRRAVGLPQTFRGVRVETGWHRFFSGPGGPQIHNLEHRKELWDAPQAVRLDALRSYWIDRMVPREIVLKQDSDQVFVTPSKKRVYFTTSRDKDGDDCWEFYAKPKSYELLALLCWDRDRQLIDFIVPQKIYVERWSSLKKSQGKLADIHFSVRRSSGTFSFELDGSKPVDITEFHGKYELMR